MSFVQTPQWLALLPLVPLLAAWDWRRSWAAPRARRVVAVGLRALLVALLVLAAAGPRWHSAKSASDVVFVVDRSASVPDDALHAALREVEAMRAGLGSADRAGLVLFDGAPEVVVFPGDPWELPAALRPDEPVEATDLDAAVALATGLVEGAGRVVLLSDGRPTSGDALVAASGARARGVPVHTRPLAPVRRAGAVAEVTLAAEEVRPGETLSGEIVLEGGAREAVAELVLEVDGKPAQRLPVRVPAGTSVRVPFTHPVPPGTKEGWVDVEARLVGDPVAVRARQVVRRPPKVWGVTADPAETMPLRRVLKAEGMDFETVTPRALEGRLHELAEVDLVVLGNVATVGEPGDVGLLPAAFPEALRRYVSSGGGLVTLGGRRSYANGGWDRSELARILPVEMDTPEAEIDPPVSLVVILDTSGSMAAWAGGSTKIALADEGAVASLELLRPTDRFGLMAFDDHASWVVPLGSPSKEAAARRIRTIGAVGGGIFVYSALVEAETVLKKADSPLKHVILFCDAADAEEKSAGTIMGWGHGESSYAVAERMKAKGITTSVIAIGRQTDLDAHFLERLAVSGGGRHYRTSDASELRALFVQETQRLVTDNVREGSYELRVLTPHPALAGIDLDRAPPLGGLVALKPRRTATVVLEGPGGEPVMTTWRYGLGEVVALGIDAGPLFAERWLDWDGYPRLWTQLARHVLRDRAGDATAVEVAQEGDGAVIRVARRTDGLSADEEGLRARLVDVDERATDTVPLRVTEPGMWEARVKTRPGAAYRVEVLGDAGRPVASRSFTAAASAEARHRTADHALLAEIARVTGGTADGAVIAGPSIQTSEVHAVWGWLVLAAALLLPLDAWARKPARG